MRVIAAAAIGLCLTAVCAAQQTASQLTVTLNTSQTAPPVSKYLYGMFTEHIRNSLSRSLWAELLDDRKFYFPINSRLAARPTAAGGGGGRGAADRVWRPIGPDEVVVMDKAKPFVGGQSPRIILDASTPHGIRQSGFAVVKGKRYTGHIVLRGAPGAHVKVTLIWGTGEADRQTVSINTAQAGYHTVR